MNRGHRGARAGAIAVVLAACLAVACSRSPSAADAAVSATPPAPASLTFIHDDYAAARAQAKARKVPIFVETWAPW